MIITIDRQCGCGGHRVGVLLAEKLGVEYPSLFGTNTERSFWKNQKKSVNSRKTAISLMKNR